MTGIRRRRYQHWSQQLVVQAARTGDDVGGRGQGVGGRVELKTNNTHPIDWTVTSLTTLESPWSPNESETQTRH